MSELGRIDFRAAERNTTLTPISPISEPVFKEASLPNLSAETRELLNRTTPKEVRFIKLGAKNAWWPLARDTNSLRLGFREFDFALCKSGQWKNARERFAAAGGRRRASDITRAVNQVRQFFELPKTVLWFTLADGDVWWCFATPDVVDIGSADAEEATKSGAFMRRVIDRWHNTDVAGDRLSIDVMTTKITKIVSFQETIAEKPDGATDLLRRIRREHSEFLAKAIEARTAIVSAVGDLLDQLHQDDFELLIELIFSASGWRRISRLGGNQKTIDFAMLMPTTGELSFVQVKSQTTRTVLRKSSPIFAR